MDEEMRFHLEESTRELERLGHDRVSARRAAILAFGGVESTKEEARDSRGGRAADDLIGDCRHAVRQALRAPAHTVAVVGILAVAVVGLSLALALARAYLHRPLPFPHPDRLVHVIAGPSRNPLPNPPDLRGVDWTPAARGFEVTGAWDLDGFTIVQPGAPPEFIDGAWVSPGFFELRGLRPALGRPFLPGEFVPGSNIALISDALWRRRFGADSSVVGSSVRMFSTDRPDEDALVTIVGVLPATSWELRFSDVLRPLGTPRMFSIARLPPGVNAASAAEQLTAAIRVQLPTLPAEWRMSLTTAQDEHVYPIRPMLQVLVVTALLLLLLAQANVAALLLARTSTRLHELAIRRALGAGNGRIARQLAVETGLLGTIGLLAALGLTPLLSGPVARGVERFAGVSVPGGVEAVRLDAVVLGTVVAVTVLSFALLSILPSLRLAARPATATASMRATAGPRSIRFRRMLSILQMAAAVALLAQGALLARSVQTMLSLDLGFEPDRLLKAHLLLPQGRYPNPDARNRAFEAVIARVNAIPGVLHTATVAPHPFRGTVFARVECDGCGSSNGAVQLAAPQTVTAGYFSTMGIPLIEGRLFDARDAAEAAPVAIVSAALASRFWPPGQAIGKRVRRAGSAEGEWQTVVGVVRDIRKTYSDSLYPDLYQPFGQAPRAYAALMVRTGSDPRLFGNRLRQAVMAEEATLALSDLEPMTELLSMRRGRAVILAGMVGGIALLAFGIAIVGLYAVVAYLGRLRRREFAVRTALGAQPVAIVGAVLRESWSMLGFGFVLGIGVAAAAGRLSRAYLVGVSPLDLSTYAGVITAATVVALAALIIPARQAAQVDPVIALREE